MASIDCKKIYDVVPTNLGKNCLKMYKISGEIIKFIKNTMENWIVELTIEGKSLTEVNIQRKIFQGDALFTITICNRDDVTQSHTNEMHRWIQTS